MCDIEIRTFSNGLGKRIPKSACCWKMCGGLLCLLGLPDLCNMIDDLQASRIISTHHYNIQVSIFKAQLMRNLLITPKVRSAATSLGRSLSWSDTGGLLKRLQDL